MAGRENRHGERDTATGKIKYQPQQRYGAAEALGMLTNKYERPATAGATSSSASLLRRSPSQQELDALLRRRSRARGRGGECATWVEVVQPKWSVLYAAGSSSAVSMKPK